MRRSADARPAVALATLIASLVSARPSPARAQQAPPLPERFTIQQALSAPFPTELVGSHDGRSVAWVYDAEGARNVWIATAPSWKGRPLTHFTGDDGWEISSPRWLSDGTGVVFVRGDGKNSHGEYPNPAHDPAGRRQVIMLARLDGSPARILADGDWPEPSPDGRTVAFIHDDHVWSVGVDSGSVAAQLFDSRGKDRGIRWSPDGSALAFTSRRGDHSFVGVFDVRTRTLRYMDPSVDRDAYPVWSPHGDSVAFVRQPAFTRQPVHTVLRAGRPWSIRVADARTGKGREVWRAASGAGSFFRAMDDRDQLAWTAGGRLVFPWESGGWLRLYGVGAAGGDPVLLTPGDREVQAAALGVDGRTMVYVANEGDTVDLWHVWSVSSKSGAPTLLTPGRGIEWEPVSVVGGVAILHSTARTPARPAIVRGVGAVADLARAAIPAGFPARSELVVPQQVTFRSTDGLLLHGQLFRPPPRVRGAAERVPAIVFFHGGSRRQMLLGFHPMGYYHNAYALNQYLASRGYIVLSVNYRGGIGYGLDFREAIGYGPGGGTEGLDAIATGRYVKTLPGVDTARVGVWGGSYGGYMTAMSLARDPEDYKVGVDFAGVHDWNLEWRHLIDTWNEDREMAARRVAYASSPMSDLSRWRAPVLLIQGDDDRNVAFAQTVQLTEDLRDRGVHVETLIYPDETHEWLLHRHWVQSYEATAAFLMRYLR